LTVPAPTVLRQGVELRNVSFRYPGSEAMVLDNVNLLLPAGATVALVGDNGAGKTTLVKLLCRFYDPTSGKVHIDGHDLCELDIDEWWARISPAFQDFGRLEFLARETIGVGDVSAVDDTVRVEAVAADAGAGAVISRLEHGLETQLGRQFENGAELSTGQWQKLAVARASMREQPLLVLLDEPTAALDARAEHQLFERYTAMKEAARPRGALTVLVSHRFSTVAMADLIVVLEHGRVLEQGSHVDLMEAGGRYAEMYEMQARAFTNVDPGLAKPSASGS
jgi:ATP-binding cassette subfamily B protein